MDDYIISGEPVVDYLTEYSGITANDLDPISSNRPLVTLKTAYKKLRILVDYGCIFIGHGLKKDFRIMNILIPPSQVIDTVELYFIPSKQRLLSLRFLAWIVLGQIIQEDSHDSIVDAKISLDLYKKYKECTANGTFETLVERIYMDGTAFGFKVPPLSRLDS